MLATITRGGRKFQSAVCGLHSELPVKAEAAFDIFQRHARKTIRAGWRPALRAELQTIAIDKPQFNSDKCGRKERAHRDSISKSFDHRRGVHRAGTAARGARRFAFSGAAAA